MNEFHDHVKNDCSLTLRSRLANKLCSLTSVCCDRLRSLSLSRRCCSLAVALPSRSRRNLSFALSNSIVVETDGRHIGVEEDEDEDSMNLFEFEFEFELCTCK